VSLTLSLSGIFTASGHLVCCSFSLDCFGMYAMYINIYIYIYIFTYVNVQEKIMPLHFCVPPSLVAVRSGSHAWIELAALL
jgi:hypothetical protein